MSSDTSRQRRPRIAIPGRFSDSASALRFGAVVNARALLEAVWAAGGDPVTLLPTRLDDDTDLAARLFGYDAVLMPGGADIDPAIYRAEHAYGTDEPDPLQDAFDIAVMKAAIDGGLPMLTVCRGTQLLNAILGGTLEQNMASSHVNSLHTLSPLDPEFLGAEQMEVSCYHHQCIDKLAEDLEASAYAEDGTVEAVRYTTAPGWVRGVQWHPEDNASTNLRQQHVLKAFVAVAASRLSTPALSDQPTHPPQGD